MKSSHQNEEWDVPENLFVEEVVNEKEFEPYYCKKHLQGRSQYLSPLAKRCSKCKIQYLTVWKSYVYCNSCSFKEERCQACGESKNLDLKEIEENLLPESIGEYEIIKKLK